MRQLLRDIKDGKLADSDALYERVMEIYGDVCGDYGRDVFERQVMPAAFKSHDGDYLALARDVLRVMSRGMHLQTEEIDLFFELSAGRILHGERHKEAWNEYMKWNADCIFKYDKHLTRRLLSRINPELAEEAKETGIWDFVPSGEHLSWDESTDLRMSILDGFYPTVG